MTKVVDWSEIAPDAGQQFTICVEGPSFQAPDCQPVGHMGGILPPWSGLIPGEYTITEISPGSAWDVAIEGSPAIVPEDGGMASATVTNTRKLGSLAVTKVVDWSGVTPDVGQQFTICVEGPSYQTAHCQTVDYDGDDLYWGELIPGDYTISETDPGSVWLVEVAGSPATVPVDGGSASATVTNTFQLGWLRVTKTVDWGWIAPDSSKQFTICIAGPSYLDDYCQTIGHTGGILSWNDLIPGDYVVTESDPGDWWRVDIGSHLATVPPGDSGVTVGISNHNKGSIIRLPLLTRRYISPAPDLVVDDILVTSDSLQVVISNVGNAPVLPTDEFWVDLYINPDPVPTGVDQTWGGLCDQGMVWGVEQSALPLESGGTITLTMGGKYYWEEYSIVSWPLAVGTVIYVQVDSADVMTTYGAVLERHEIAGDPYNNISHIVYQGLAGTEEAAEVERPVVGGRPSTAPSWLPPRP